MGSDHCITIAVTIAQHYTGRDTDRHADRDSDSDPDSDGNADAGSERDSDCDAGHTDADSNTGLLYFGPISGHRRLHLFTDAIPARERTLQEPLDREEL